MDKMKCQMNNSMLQRTANYLQGLGSNVRFFLKYRFTGSPGSIFPCLGNKDKGYNFPWIQDTPWKPGFNGK